VLELALILTWEILGNGTVSINDKFMHQVVEHTRCDTIRSPYLNEMTLRTEEADPHCYIIRKDAIMKKVNGRWESLIKRSWK
jgi:hypothetical protein